MIAPAAPPSRLRLLLVEDDPDLADVVEELLDGAGFEVHGARTLDSAHERASASDYAAVLIDFGMTKGSGWSEFERLNHALPGAVVGVVTAWNVPEREVLEHG